MKWSYVIGNYVFKIWEMVEKMKTKRNFETECSLSTSVLIFFTISQILKTKFYALWT